MASLLTPLILFLSLDYEEPMQRPKTFNPGILKKEKAMYERKSESLKNILKTPKIHFLIFQILALVMVYSTECLKTAQMCHNYKYYMQLF